MDNNSKFLAAVVVALLVGVWTLTNGNEVQAEKQKRDQIKFVQHIYDNALDEIGNGNRKGGCKELRRALIHSKDIEDDGNTYYNIRVIGTTVCNWVGATKTVVGSNVLLLDTIQVTANK
jgi:hypothetical protein